MSVLLKQIQKDLKDHSTPEAKAAAMKQEMALVMQTIEPSSR